MKYVQGFEFTDDEAAQLHPDVVWILGHIRRFGAAVFELDDSEDSAIIREQLRLTDGEYFDVHIRGGVITCIDSDRFAVKGEFIGAEEI